MLVGHPGYFRIRVADHRIVFLLEVVMSGALGLFSGITCSG